MGLLGNIGLSTLKSQIIAASVVLIPFLIFAFAKAWKTDIEESARQKLENDLQQGRIKTLEKGADIDAKILEFEDADFCAVLGGCSVPDKIPNN